MFVSNLLLLAYLRKSSQTFYLYYLLTLALKHVTKSYTRPIVSKLANETQKENNNRKLTFGMNRQELLWLEQLHILAEFLALDLKKNMDFTNQMLVVL